MWYKFTLESIPTERRLTKIFIYCFILELLTWLRRRYIYFFPEFFIFRKHKFPFKHHHEQIGQLIRIQKLLSYPHLHIQYRKYNWKISMFVTFRECIYIYSFAMHDFDWCVYLVHFEWKKTNQSNDFYRYWFDLLSVSFHTPNDFIWILFEINCTRRCFWYFLLDFFRFKHTILYYEKFKIFLKNSHSKLMLIISRLCQPSIQMP